MRAARGALAALQRGLKSSEALGRQLQHLQGLSTRAAAEAGSGSRSRGGLGLLAAGGAAAAAAYGFSAQPVVAQAEAPGKAEKGPVDAVPDEARYQRPAGARGVLPKEVIIYQYDVCPFCCKVKAFLDYHKIPYRCVEVNPLTKAELKWSQYRKVPVVVVDGEQVNDSSVIISRLAAELEAAGGSKAGGSGSSGSSSGESKGWLSFLSSGSGSSGKPGSGNSGAAADRAVEEKWRRWVDEWFVRVITVNIYRNMGESLQTFDYISQNGNFGWVSREAARLAGAGMMWGISGKLKKKYGMEGDVRECLYTSANEWVDALEGRPFLGGASPDLADLAVFGVVRAVTGTDTFNDLMQNSRIGGWYARMFEAVGPSARLS